MARKGANGFSTRRKTQIKSSRGPSGVEEGPLLGGKMAHKSPSGKSGKAVGLKTPFSDAIEKKAGK
jgi:hypothetical protein